MENIKRYRLGGIITALILADLTSSLETSMIFSALPTIVRETGNISGSGWLITGYLLVMAASAAIGGRLGDLYGRRKVLVWALSISCIGSIISATANDFGLVISGRAIQGAAGAILPLCYGLIRENIPKSKSPFWIGTIGGVYALGGALGYLSGALFVKYAHWQDLFYTTVVLPLIAIAAVLLLIPPSRENTVSKRNFDLVGGILFVPGIAGILIGVTEAPKWGWSSPLPWLCMGAGIAILILWAFYERRHANPLIDVTLLTGRQIALANGLYLCAGLGAVQLPLIMMMLLQQPVATGVGLGVSAVFAAIVKLPGNLCSGAGAPIAGLTARRFGSKSAAIYGMIIQSVVWIAYIFFHDSFWVVVIGMAVSSFATGLILGATPNLVIDVAPDGRTSETTGMISVTRSISTAIGAQIIAIILAASTVSVAETNFTPYPSEIAYMAAFGFIAFVTLVGLLLAVLLPTNQVASRYPDNSS